LETYIWTGILLCNASPAVLKKINLGPQFKAAEKGCEWEKRGYSVLRKHKLAKIM
jgi:hypothetical protein